MKNLFLIKLFQHSKPAFVFVMLFLIGYSITFWKKMDMMFYPYNSMFSIDFNKNYTASTYAAKLNEERVKITNQLYWKKDFLEATITNYAKYIQHNRAVFLDDYLNYKITNNSTRSFFSERLIPERNVAMKWPYWYCNFAGYTAPKNSNIELIQYTFLFSEGKAVITDSTSIYKTSLP